MIISLRENKSLMRERALRKFHKEKIQSQKDHLRNLLAKKARLEFEIEDLQLSLKRNLLRTQKDLRSKKLSEHQEMLLESSSETYELYETIIEVTQFLQQQNSLSQRELEFLEITLSD